MITFPCVIVNFKTYSIDPVLFARAISVTENVYACPQLPDLKEVGHICQTLAQHVDASKQGKFTGAVLPEKILEAGAFGSLINHSEKRVPWIVVKESVKRLKKLGLASVVCVKNVKELNLVKKFNPTAIAVEPPELIGGKISVSVAKPSLIRNACKNFRNVLVGAGINNQKDVEVAMRLGAKGILVSSAVIKSSSPERWMENVIEVFDAG
ncbi:MAG: triose-phosphate isomerase [Nanoarchaeota archaeon]|nr:triose-phosphate isomerase [Nanoarchaeota archaeon]